MAIDANEYGLAEAYADEILRSRETAPRGVRGGDEAIASARYIGEIVRGKAALHRDDVEAASVALENAGRASPAGPAISSYGPDLELADALLKLGRSDEVTAYLMAFLDTSPLGQQQLRSWIGDIAGGGTPTLTSRSYAISMRSILQSVRGR
jgi:hypothetical protein